MKKLKAGVIGHTGRGDYGHIIDERLAMPDEVEMVALADANPEGLKEAGAKWDLPEKRCYLDYHEMLGKEYLDLLGIGPHQPDQRKDMIVAAANTGVKGIFTEKPLARTLEEVDAMLEACNASGTKVQIRRDFRTHSSFLKLKEEIDKGLIGEVKEIHATAGQDERGGGLGLIFMGVHIFDIILDLAGPPNWVQGTVMANGREATPEDATWGAVEVGPIMGDHVKGIYGFDNGVIGTFTSRKNAGCTTYEVYGTEGILSFQGYSGGQLFYYDEPYWTPVSEEGGEWKEIKSEINHPGLVPDLVDAVRNNRQPLSNLTDGQWALEIILGIYGSYIAGKRITLPAEDRKHPLRDWIEESEGKEI